jgi:hypothetical protein
MNLKLGKAHKLSRRMFFRDLAISIETDKGELRHWYDPHNKEKGTTKMKYPYGYIRRTKGVDGDHVDVYVGPHEKAPYVYIIHQMKAPEFKKYDEDKCMLGFKSENAAKTAYLAHYNDKRFLGSVTRMPYDKFEKKVRHSFSLKKPHKIAEDQMSHLNTAYLLGQQAAINVFTKEAGGVEDYMVGGLGGALSPEGEQIGGSIGGGLGSMAGGAAGTGLAMKTLLPSMLEGAGKGGSKAALIARLAGMGLLAGGGAVGGGLGGMYAGRAAERAIRD